VSNETDFKTALAELIEARSDADHPDPGDVAAYVGGELAAAPAQRLEQHLLGCRDCVALARDLACARQAAGDAVADFELAAAWRALQARLEAEDAASRRAARRWLPAIAAILAVAVLGLGLAVWRLEASREAMAAALAELEAPQVDLPILYLDAVTRAGDEPPPRIPPGGRSVVLIVTPPVDSDFPAYDVELRRAGGELAWQGRDLTPSDYGTLRLLLPRRLLAAGANRLELFGRRGHQRQPLATYPLAFR